MTDDVFATAQDSAGDGENFRAADNVGLTVMFLGHEKDSFEGDFGKDTVARCSLVLVLDSDEGVKAYTDALVFGKALAPTIYRSPKPVVLGVIGKGEAKPGKSAPWVLLEPEEATIVAARKFYTDKVKESAGTYFYAPDEAPF